MVKSIEIKTIDIFDEYYKWYGYEEFTRKVLQKCANKKEYGLVGIITLIDAEPSKRIYFENEQGEDFTIRYFISWQNEKQWKAGYTLYRSVRCEDGSGYGVDISEGSAVASYVYDGNEGDEN
jgi:hypothetical protein